MEMRPVVRSFSARITNYWKYCLIPFIDSIFTFRTGTTISLICLVIVQDNNCWVESLGAKLPPHRYTQTYSSSSEISFHTSSNTNTHTNSNNKGVEKSNMAVQTDLTNKKNDSFEFYSPILLPKRKADDEEETLILLNSPTFTGGTVLETLWERSSVRICADGGANRLHAYDSMKIPNVICGDLDSLTPKVQKYYEDTSGGDCQVISAPDQNANDLEKSVHLVASTTRQVHVYGALGGRLDQEMASFHALYSFLSKGKHLALYDEENVAIVLPANTNCILNFPINTICGLIPLAYPCESVTTSGLHWDVNEQKLELGGDLISTSNHFDSNTVHVHTSHPLLFTAQLLCPNPTNGDTMT